jgi:hypothetical protein
VDDPYLQFCETLWRDWLAGAVDPSECSGNEFDLDAAPEPYLSFDAGAQPLVALTTNPGATMLHQTRAAVQLGQGPLRNGDDYVTTARALGSFYESRLAGPARTRIAALRSLSSILGTDGVLQVEACPFHSPFLARKEALLRTIGRGGLLGQYADRLRGFLQPRPVVVVSAVSSRAPLSNATLKPSPWLAWKSSVAGIDLAAAEFIALTTKANATTSGALVSGRGGVAKALVLMMGGNHLPAQRGLRVLADALQRASGTPVRGDQTPEDSARSKPGSPRDC